MKIMNAKFAGRCNACKQAINVGDTILWERGNTRHNSCPPASTVVVPVNVVPAAPKPVVNQSLIVDFLNRAKAHGLKFPKVCFLAPAGGTLRLSMAGSGSKYPGAIQVKVNDNWVGRINTDGTVTSGRDMTTAIIGTLTTIALDPVTAAKAYGALNGRCSFCNLPLTDEGSVEVGYGPICAKHYGLPHSPKGSKALTVNVPVSTPVLESELPASLPKGQFRTILEMEVSA